MNLFALSMLLVFLPAIAQIVLGAFALRKETKLSFSVISLINVLLLIAMFFIGIELIDYDLTRQFGKTKCGTPFVAFFFYGLMIFILQVIIVFIQLMIKKVKKL